MLVRIHQAEIIVVNCFIQRCKAQAPTWAGVEPRFCEHMVAEETALYLCWIHCRHTGKIPTIFHTGTMHHWIYHVFLDDVIIQADYYQNSNDIHRPFLLETSSVPALNWTLYFSVTASGIFVYILFNRLIIKVILSLRIR